jgi:2-desacetyl-2-hydroxyethyl bacteriochlorophyllide A dehydrogenase
VLGHELSGEVVEAPSGGVLRPGQMVVVNPYVACGACVACRNGKPNCCMRIGVLGVHRDGGMCEAISVPARNLYPVEDLSFDQAASVEFLAIGAHAVARSALRPDARVLVVGAGPIGLGVALFARVAGGHTTVLDMDAERLAFAQRIGVADATIVADEHVLERVRDAASGEGYEVVFDATGAKASIEAAFAYVAHGGSLVLVSVISETISFSDPEFHKREMTVMGTRNALRADFERVIDAIRTGKAPLQDLLTHRTTLSDVVNDLPRWAKEKRGLVKALVEVA